MNRRVEYRVVAEHDSVLGGPFSERNAAEARMRACNPIGFNIVYRNIRIQVREVVTTPWEDLEEK